jgi:hypothetical protein
LAGKTLLYIRREALRQLFCDTCIHSYQALGKVGALVERAVWRADSIARSSALQLLRESLKLRGGRGCQFFLVLHAPLIHSQVRDDDGVK